MEVYTNRYFWAHDDNDRIGILLCTETTRQETHNTLPVPSSNKIVLIYIHRKLDRRRRKCSGQSHSCMHAGCTIIVYPCSAELLKINPAWKKTTELLPNEGQELYYHCSRHWVGLLPIMKDSSLQPSTNAWPVCSRTNGSNHTAPPLAG